MQQIFLSLGWKRIVGFQTRQPIHRPQFEMTLQAMQAAKANLLAMRMAGPREAILHMIIGKNFGCTHFVIGHDHGSPGMYPNRQTQFSLQAPISINA